MQKVFFCFLSIILGFKSIAQTSASLRLNVFMPGIAYERPIYKDFTLHTNLLFLTNVTYNGNIGLGVSFNPALMLHARKYFNLEKRSSRGTDIRNNSGNYFFGGINLVDDKGWYINYLNKINGQSIYAERHFEKINLTIPVGWGMQRTFAQSWQVDFGVGVTYMQKYKDLGVLFYLKIGNIFWPKLKVNSHESD